VPGNPVSALICAALFLRPAIARLLGLSDTDPPLHRMRLATPLGANDARADHLRATIEQTSDGPVVVPMPIQDSSRLRDLNRADALIVRAPHAPALAAGETVDVMLLPELGI
jgi:molybdopterin molybdotransferase